MAEQSLYDEFQKQRGNPQRQMRLGVANELQHDPERSGRILAVSTATGLPNEVVDADLENLEKRLKTEEFNYANYTDKENGAPIFNKFAEENPYNFSVLDRDFESMTAIERAATQIDLGWDSGWATIEMSKIANRDVAGEARPEDAARMKELNALMQGGDFGADSILTKALVFTAQQLPIQGYIVAGSIDETLIGAGIGAAYGAGTGAMAGGIGALPGAIAGAITGAGRGFLAGRVHTAYELEGGLAFAQFQELGLNREDSIMASRGVGAVNAALESIGVGALAKRIPGFRNIMKDRTGDAIARAFTNPNMKGAITRLTLQYGEGMATEIVTEVAQETTLMLAQEMLKDQARDAGDNRPELEPITSEEFWDTWKQTAIHTMYGTSMIGAAGPIMNYRADSKRAQAAMERQQQLKAVGEAAADSVNRTEAKTLWEHFLGRLAKEGPVKEIRIDSEGWKTYWQSQELDPAEVAKELGIDLSESDTLDVDITVPFDVFVDKIAATEHMEGLMKDMRVREDEMTVNESIEWQSKRADHIEQLKKALGDEIDTPARDEMVTDLEGQLIAAGTEPKAAKQMAEFHSLVIMNKAQQSGLDPMEFYKATLAGVFRDVPEALTAAGQDIDMDVDPLLDAIRNDNFPHQRDIYGESLIDMIRRVGGIKDDGGELSARDVGKQLPGTVSNDGKSIDAIAELAAEAGFITEGDENLLMEALDRELAGTQVFSRNASVDTDLEALLSAMERAAQFLDQENIDLNEMSNADVRKYLEGIKTLDQSSSDSLKEWSDLLIAMTLAGEKSPEGTMVQPNEIDTMLSKAEVLAPRVAANQNFKDVEFTDRVIEDGKGKDVTYKAQDRYNNAVRSRNMLKQLAKCVNG